MKVKLVDASSENLAALSYVFFFISGIYFFVTHKQKFVRFHAAQSIVVFLPLFIFQWLASMSILFSSLTPLVSLLIFILWLLLIYKAWQGEEYEVPFLGQFTHKFLNTRV